VDRVCGIEAIVAILRRKEMAQPRHPLSPWYWRGFLLLGLGEMGLAIAELVTGRSSGIPFLVIALAFIAVAGVNYRRSN
jgi:hypothetical protein